MANVDSLNHMPLLQARAALLRCCGSIRWVEQMLAHRPFASSEALHTFADEEWATLDHADWLEAFAAHPRIGDVASLRQKFSGAADLSLSEQAGVSTADEATIQALADANRTYEDRFGHIFIVCATGKSAPEMLAILQSRLANDPATELEIAAAEQLKIIHLRLDKL